MVTIWMTAARELCGVSSAVMWSMDNEKGSARWFLLQFDIRKLENLLLRSDGDRHEVGRGRLGAA